MLLAKWISERGCGQGGKSLLKNVKPNKDREQLEWSEICSVLMLSDFKLTEPMHFYKVSFVWLFKLVKIKYFYNFSFMQFIAHIIIKRGEKQV